MIQFKFDCIFYYVSDIEKSISFYKNVLGFRLISRDIIARFDADGVLFELVPCSDKSKIGGYGNARLCLKVDDIQDAIDHLKIKGVHTADLHEVANGFLVPCYDPDENEIILWQYKKL
ncbi:MAG: VOC family protein [Acidobacteriota bacterium]